MTARYTRRSLFRRVGPAAFLLSPLLRVARVEAASARKRFVLFHLPNGYNGARFWPSGDGKAFDLTGKTLQPLAPLKDKMLLIKGLKHPGGGHSEISGLFTNRKLIGDNLADGPSIDWFLAQKIAASAQKTPVHSLQLGIDCPSPASKNCSQTKDDTGAIRALENDPAKVFDDLFKNLKASCVPGAAASSADDLRRRSILDAVRVEIASAKKQLGLTGPELLKLDQHESSIRALEAQLAALKDRAGSACASSADPKTFESSIRNSAMALRGRAHADLTLLALELDMTAVVAISHFFEGGNAGKQLDLAWFRAGKDGYDPNGETLKVFHHRLSHRDSSEAPNIAEKLFAVDKWVFENLAYLATRMDQITTSSGSLLDNSCVLYMSTIGDGKLHSINNIPCLILGSAGGRLPVGQFMTNTVANHGRVLTSVIQAFGHDVAEFGNKGGSTALF
jgi:hypothetical protein